MAIEDDDLVPYEALHQKFEEWDEQDRGDSSPRPFRRYTREIELMHVYAWKEGTFLYRCPKCSVERTSFRDRRCPRCHGVGSLLCVPVQVKDGLV